MLCKISFLDIVDIFTCHPPLSFCPFQSRFADALLRELAGVTVPSERIYGLGTGLEGPLISLVKGTLSILLLVTRVFLLFPSLSFQILFPVPR